MNRHRTINPDGVPEYLRRVPGWFGLRNRPGKKPVLIHPKSLRKVKNENAKGGSYEDARAAYKAGACDAIMLPAHLIEAASDGGPTAVRLGHRFFRVRALPCP